MGGFGIIHETSLEGLIINGGAEASLAILPIDEIMRQNEAAGGAGPVNLVEEKITKTIINRFVVIKFVSLGLVGGSADHHISAEVDEMAEKVLLARDGGVAGGHFGAIIGISITFKILDINNYKISVGFGGGDIIGGVGFVVDVGAGVIAGGALAVGFGGSGIIVAQQGDFGGFLVNLEWRGG